MKLCLVAIPHSHTWFWTQSCVSALTRYPPRAEGVECHIVVVDNSWDWSPAIRGVEETKLRKRVSILRNTKPRKFHASGLDCVVENYEFDYLMALETDALVLRHGWLEWFLGQMGDNTSAVGHYHHEGFINPSCTLYRGSVLREMSAWCKANNEPVQNWGESFGNTRFLKVDGGEDMVSLQGPFAETRGWPPGTVLKQQPSGQCKGPGWYEPGQALDHWAGEKGWAGVVCPNVTTFLQPGLPTQTLYGITEDPRRNLEVQEMLDGQAYACHFWGGTRALDLLKHPVTDGFVLANMPFWLEREARVWNTVVPGDVRAETLALIKKHGWHTRGIAVPGAEAITDRDWEAVRTIEGHYRSGGVSL